jgi:hypothetical protein
MLRSFAQTFCDAILRRLQGGRITSEQGEESESDGLNGLTRDIPFSPLEQKATTRIAAAQEVFAEVDLSAWSLPSETDKEASARVVLRRFACRWWVRNLEREGMRWWRKNGRDPEDLAAIEDCLFRAWACSYWHWHRGSRFSFGGSL